MSDKLRKCPFCGSTPEMEEDYSSKLRCLPSINVFCFNPECPICNKRFDKLDWNTRHEPKHETVEQLHELSLEYLHSRHDYHDVTSHEDELIRTSFIAGIVANHHGKQEHQ